MYGLLIIKWYKGTLVWNGSHRLLCHETNHIANKYDLRDGGLESFLRPNMHTVLDQIIYSMWIQQKQLWHISDQMLLCASKGSFWPFVNKLVILNKDCDSCYVYFNKVCSYTQMSWYQCFKHIFMMLQTFVISISILWGTLHCNALYIVSKWSTDVMECDNFYKFMLFIHWYW